MSRFVEQAITRAGLLPVLTSRRAGDIESVRTSLPSWRGADLLALGAIADLLRQEEEGDDVHIHETAHGETPKAQADVLWIDAGTTELDVLREIAVARIASKAGTRIGIDWGRYGLELAQVALGFGVTDLRGPITRKSGLPILEEEVKKVKGKGMQQLRDLQKLEISNLVTYAGRQAIFVDERAAKRNDASRSEGRDSEVAGA